MQVLLSAVLSFRVVKQTQTAEKISTNGSVTLTCKSDDYYEYCTWSHVVTGAAVRECNFEWKRKHDRVRKQECHDELESKVSISGNYEAHECGLRIQGVSLEDAGRWNCEMEEYILGRSKGSGTKSSRMFLLKVEAPTTTTTTTTVATTTMLEDTAYHPDYLDYSGSENSGEEKESKEYHDHKEVHQHYDDNYPMTAEVDLHNHDHHSHDEEYLTDGEDPHDELEEHEHNIREHSEAMTEHEFLDHYGANETFIESSRLHVDEAEARDSQLIENSSSSGPVVGIVVGVVVAVLAAAGVVAGVMLFRRRRTTAGVVTMSKILEDSEARGSILEEAEYHPRDRKSVV